MMIELWPLFVLMGYIVFFAWAINSFEMRVLKEKRDKMVLEFTWQLADFENEFNQNNRDSDDMFQSIDPQEEMRNNSEEYNHAPRGCTARDKSIS